MDRLVQTRVRLREGVEELFGVQLFRASRHGHRDCIDLKRSGCQFSVVFDVGANEGDSALRFRAAFPKATVYSFEPVHGTFEDLKRNVGGDDLIKPYQLALGSKDGDATIYLTGDTYTNSLVKPDRSVGSEVVKVRTLDGFTSENGIERIDLLKIDTEGLDLEVLKGAHKKLSSGRVAFVLVEVGFHPGDARHVLFDDVRSFLVPMGFAVFGIYDQQPEWSGENRLRFANACFCNESACIRA